MARTILIDGANAVYAIFGSGQSSRSAWDSDAIEFVSAIQSWAASQPNLEVEIIFDGGFRKLTASSGHSVGGRVRVIFSDTQTADSVILERIAAASFYEKSTTVVTQDRELARAAMADGAKILSPGNFWGYVRGR